jgi:hypothetical protein
MINSSTWVACLASVSLLVSVASAQSTPPAPITADAHEGDRSELRTLISKGITEYNLGHWTEAKAFFLRAHALQPSARTLRTLGLVSYELRSYVDASRYLEQAIASQERPLTPDMRAAALTVLEQARSFVGQVRVTVEPPDATLRMQGQPLPLGPDRTVLLDPGQYEFSAELTGFTPVTRLFEVKGAEQSQLHLRLQPIREVAAPAAEGPAPGAAPFARARPTTHDPSFFESLSTGQHVAIALGAVSVVGIAVGSVLSVIAVNENEASNRTCTEQRCTDPGGRDHRRSAQAHADGATVAFIGAGALLATAGVLWFATGDAADTAGSAGISAGLAPGTAWLSYREAF